MPFLAGQRTTAAALNAAVKKIVARGNRITASTVSTGSTVGVLRLDDVPISGSHAYTIVANPILESTVAADALQVEIRYTTDGSTPSTSSTVLPESRGFGRIHTANSGEMRSIRAIYEPSANETLSILLCVQRIAGTGNCRIFADSSAALGLAIYHSGDAVGDSGTDI